MPRQRSPKRDLAYQLWIKSNGEKKLKDIAVEVGVSEGQIRKWKNIDNWNGNVTNAKSYVAKQKEQKKKRAIAKDVEQVMNNPELTEKQKLFCLYYIKSFNATRAYQKAYGCDYETAMRCGSRLLRNVDVKNEIQCLKQNRLNRELLDESDIFQKYIDIAFADITDFVSFGRKEVEVIGLYGPIMVKDENDEKVPLRQVINTVDIKESTEVDGTLITEISQSKSGVKIKLGDRMKALEWLAEHMDLATAEQKARVDKMYAEISKINNDNTGDNDMVMEFIKAMRQND